MNHITLKPINASLLKQRASHEECGGIVSFEGVVRNHHDGKSVTKLYYQAYENMADQLLGKLKDEAKEKWPESHIEVLHRIGELHIGDVAVAIVAWAPHRKEAFLACEWMINHIKRRVPIWKQEHYTNGEVSWVQCHHNHNDA